MWSTTAQLFISLILLGLSCFSHAQEVSNLEEKVLAVPLARGSTLNLILSKLPQTQPDTAALLFPGYPGVMRIRSEGAGFTFDLRGNFLVRARRHLANPDLMVVMVDCPVDMWNKCDDRYRTSDQHASDIQAAIQSLKEQSGISKFYLVGTSYGTESSAYLALKLGNAVQGAVQGAVHTATFTDPNSRGRGHGLPMWKFDWSAIKVDQLFVHHKNDPCSVTQYQTIASARGKAPLLTVLGAKGARGDVCEAFSAHGFVGRERPVMQAIGQWILNRKVPDSIGEDKVED
jgi:pimeloyl-ACP methyl ester carboxylesterase